jgi:ABC-2 type transport system permease protein
MRDIAGFEARRRLRGTALLTVVMVAFVGLTVGLFPSIAESGVDFEAYVESFPPEVQTAFLGGVTDLGTVEGFLLTELYQLIWVLVLGAYFAYAAASLVAGDVEDRTADLLLASPVSRSRIVVAKALSLLPAIVVVNGVAVLAVLVFVAVIGETVDPLDFLRLHTLFVLYHAANAAVGLVASVAVSRVRHARAGALGAVVGTYFLDALTVETDYEWLGTAALSRYFDAAEILVDAEVDPGDVGVLVVVCIVGVVLAAELFERRDVPG